MARCFLANALFLEEEFHTVGCAFRDESGLYILFNEFGETKVKKYS